MAVIPEDEMSAKMINWSDSMKRRLFYRWLVSINIMVCVAVIMKIADITIRDKLFYLLMGIPFPAFMCLGIPVFSRQIKVEKSDALRTLFKIMSVVWALP